MVSVSMWFHANSQVNYAGKDFWLTLANTAGLWTGVFYISGASDANITFDYTTPASTQTYFLKGGTILQIKLSFSEMEALAGLNQPTETVNNNSLHITSDENIVVQFLVMPGANDDGMLLFPSDNQAFGNDYYLNGPAWPTDHPGIPYAYSIVSGCDSTVIEITPAKNTRNHAAGVPYNVTLNKGNAYIIGCAFRVYSMGGTRVRVVSSSCCKPINIFITYPTTYQFWPYDYYISNPSPNPPSHNICCADQLIEQILPTSVWDTVFPVLPFANNSHNVINIVSASDNNIISFDGVPSYMLNTGKQFDTIIRGPVVIRSSAPISIVQNMLSYSETQPLVPFALHKPVDSLSDPSSLWVLPIKDGLREAYFKSATNIATGIPNNPLATGYLMNKINIICKSSSVDSIVLNNVNIASRFTKFPRDTNYMYAIIEIDTIMYHLVSRDKILAYYYGAYIQGSAAYPIGDIHADVSVNIQRSYDTVTVTKCLGSSIRLSADPAERYEWSTGESTREISVVDTGVYWVTGTQTSLCSSTEAIRHVYVRDLDTALAYQPPRQDTIEKCDTAILLADDALAYQWSTGDTTNAITVKLAGDYWVQEYRDLSECQKGITLHEYHVQDKDFGISLFIGNDTVICKGTQLILTSGFDSTRWSTGVSGSAIKVSSSGLYIATVTDPCNQDYADSILVSAENCDCLINFPTAFSPNQDGVNDIFRPVTRETFTEYYLAIYNRWGELMFDSHIYREGWDGTYKGQPMPDGVYMYICKAKCVRGESSFKGDITLIR